MENININNLKRKYPLINELINYKEVLWINDNLRLDETGFENINLDMEDIIDAQERLNRFAPFIKKAFPETSVNNGIIESPFKKIPSAKKSMEEDFGKINGSLYLKCDHLLPVSGSIKARGGIYEVLKHGETLAIENGLLNINDNYEILLEKRFKDFFKDYGISVSSTGNLGLSIGVMAAKLGFTVNVHMSRDAKKWKKDMLREKGANVIEYDADFSYAVIKGREDALNNKNFHFIDDEKSNDLFLGYSVAALRLKKQLEENNIKVDEDNPLLVYLPCGVGGGPGGVSFGLKKIYGGNVHCFFAEPTHSPAMLLGMMTGLNDKISVGDISIDNRTTADGLAVGRPSKFVGELMKYLLSGSYTLSDEKMLYNLYKIYETEGEKIEPSGLAGLSGPFILENTKIGKEYIDKQGLNMEKSNHIIWATGGSMVPNNYMDEYINMGKNIKLKDI